MSTILIEDGFKFFFYANEHEPKHIHVMRISDFAKVELKSLYVVKNYLKPKELKKAVAIIKKYQKEFERKWDEYFSYR